MTPPKTARVILEGLLQGRYTDNRKLPPTINIDQALNDLRQLVPKKRLSVREDLIPTGKESNYMTAGYNQAIDEILEKLR